MPKGLNPQPFLHGLRGEQVIVRLKWGHTEYKGKLVSTDVYMNLQLEDAEEIIDGENKGNLDEIMIRCNNVMWVGRVEQ